MNAKIGDGTIRFAGDFSSPGEICTLKAIQYYSKPWFDVDVNNPPPTSEVVAWIKDNNIGVLNVAGNRESKSPGVGAFVKDYMVKVLKEVNQ